MNSIGRVVTGGDLTALYELIKGARYSNTLLDARDALENGEIDQAIELVRTTQQYYERSHRKHLRDEKELPSEPSAGDKQAARERQRREKCRRAMELFGEVLAGLDRMAQWRQQGTGSAGACPPRPPSRSLPAGFSAAFNGAKHGQQEDVVAAYFSSHAVASAQDLRDATTYLVRAKEKNYVVVSSLAAGSETVELTEAVSGQRLKPLSRQRLLELGAAGRLLRLEPLAAEPPAADAVPPTESEEPATPAELHREILDMGAFSQLADAARRCGLVPNADVIAHVRDREFRLGKYQQASQTIEGLFGKFTAAASQREQRLRREDVDIASGRLKMSPKELLAKRARDTAETQTIHRARNRFLRVMEGLRILMRK